MLCCLLLHKLRALVPRSRFYFRIRGDNTVDPSSIKLRSKVKYRINLFLIFFYLLVFAVHGLNTKTQNFWFYQEASGRILVRHLKGFLAELDLNQISCFDIFVYFIRYCPKKGYSVAPVLVLVPWRCFPFHPEGFLKSDRLVRAAGL